MIDSSANYGLYNPAFSEDIGYAMLSRQGVNMSAEDLDEYRLSGVAGSMDGISMQGNLKEDTFGNPNSKSKKKKIITGILAGIALIGAGVLGWKFKGKLKDVGTKIADGFKSVIKKFKK